MLKNLIGQRLKSGRERLGFTQEQFAALAEATKRTVIDWEAGVSTPTTYQLFLLSENGLDVHHMFKPREAQTEQKNPTYRIIYNQFNVDEDDSDKLGGVAQRISEYFNNHHDWELINLETMYSRNSGGVVAVRFWYRYPV